MALGVLVAWTYAPRRSAAFTMTTGDAVRPFGHYHSVERFGDDGRYYRWTKGDGRLRLPNPGGNTLIELRLAGHAEGAGSVLLHHLDWALPVALRPETLRDYNVLMPAVPQERVGVAIRSPVVMDGGRALGVLVSDVGVAGGGSVPLHPLLFVMAGAVAGYGALRRWRWRPLAAAGLVTAGMALLLWAQASWGWRVGLLGLSLVIAVEVVVVALLVRCVARGRAAPWQTAVAIWLLNTGLYSVLFAAVSEGRELLFVENGAVETLTAAAFGAAVVVGLVRLWWLPGSRPLVLLGLPLLALVGFLDEVSFGKDLLGLSAPIIAGYEVDAAHDLVALAWRAVRSQPRGLLLGSAAVLLLGVLALGWWQRWRLRRGAAALTRQAPALTFVVPALAFLVPPALLDVMGQQSAWVKPIFEETFELNAALALLTGAASIGGSRGDQA
jgi:hypothetical protein